MDTVSERLIISAYSYFLLLFRAMFLLGKVAVCVCVCFCVWQAPQINKAIWASLNTGMHQEEQDKSATGRTLEGPKECVDVHRSLLVRVKSVHFVFFATVFLIMYWVYFPFQCKPSLYKNQRVLQEPVGKKKAEAWRVELSMSSV